MHQKLVLKALRGLTRIVSHAILGLYGFMLKRLAFLVIWGLLTPPLLIGAIYVTLKQNRETQVLASYPIITASEFEVNNIEGQVLGTKIDDIRPYLVSKFLNGTPLEPYSQLIVEVSDKYGIDYRFIPAIAMKESQGGSAINQSTHNAWGWENGRTNFASWESAIDIVGRTLKAKYIDRGLTTPDEIMAIYAPPQLLTGGKWAKDVNQFFSQMESL